jgi:DnaK suppressor protein
VSDDPRAELERSRDHLTSRLTALTRRPEPGSGIGFGKRVGDGTAAAVERITDVATQQTLLTKLEQVERALAKLEEGSYGRCDVCDACIPSDRLVLRPHATRCVQHAL